MSRQVTKNEFLRFLECQSIGVIVEFLLDLSSMRLIFDFCDTVDIQSGCQL